MMLARVADSLYWLGRYIERAEHLSRLSSVMLNATLDQTTVGNVLGIVATTVGTAEIEGHLQIHLCHQNLLQVTMHRVGRQEEITIKICLSEGNRTVEIETEIETENLDEDPLEDESRQAERTSIHIFPATGLTTDLPDTAVVAADQWECLALIHCRTTALTIEGMTEIASGTKIVTGTECEIAAEVLTDGPLTIGVGTAMRMDVGNLERRDLD